MIYDCFLFFNELELLDIRLHELDPVVDKFVLVEATVTHTNKPKPLYYQENKHLFKKFQKKITHIIVKDSPDVGMSWIIERYQLSAVMRGLKRCRQEDVILYSCVDEIPRAEKIIEWKDKLGTLKSFKQDLCLYFLNCVKNDGSTEDHATKMFRFKDIKTFKDIYLTIFLRPDMIIPDGGWHFSYMGGVKKIQEKLASFAHQELNNDRYNTREKIKRAIAEGKDPFGFGWKFNIADISFLPKYVQENQLKFRHLIAPKNHESKLFMHSIKIPFWELKHLFRIKFLRPLKRNNLLKPFMNET